MLRNAFFGGRTEPFDLFKDFEQSNEQGKYIDICSLYATVMFYDKYPIGYPDRIVKPKQFDKYWFGLIYCKKTTTKRTLLTSTTNKTKSCTSTQTNIWIL